MRYSTIILSLVMLLGISSCGGDKTPMVSESLGMEYWEVKNKIFENASGEGVEWHGEAVDQSAKPELEMSNGGTCGQDDCGQAVLIKNKAASDIEIILQIIHGINDIYPYFSRKVLIPAGEVLNVGCAQFCYGEKTMKLNYKIVGAVAISK